MVHPAEHTVHPHEAAAGGLSVAALELECVHNTTIKDRLPLSSSPRLGSSGSHSCSTKKRGSKRKPGSSPSPIPQPPSIGVSVAAAAKIAPPSTHSADDVASLPLSGRRSVHRDSAEGIVSKVAGKTRGITTEGDLIDTSIDPSEVEDETCRRSATVTGSSIGSCRLSDDVLHAGASSVNSSSESRTSALKYLASSGAAVYEDYTEDGATVHGSEETRPQSTSRRYDDAMKDHRNLGDDDDDHVRSWDEEIVEELEECTPRPPHHSDTDDLEPPSASSPSPRSAHHPSVTSPYDSYDENDFCACEEDAALMHGDDSPNATLSSDGCVTDSHSLFSLSHTHPFTWQNVEIMSDPSDNCAGNGVASQDKTDSWDRPSSSTTPPSDKGLEGMPLIEEIRSRLQETEQERLHPFLCLRSQQQEVLMHRSALHFEYCSSELRRQEVSMQDRVIMVKSLLSEAHRHHIKRVATMGKNLPLPPHRVHGLRFRAARQSGWRSVASEVDRSLVMEGPLTTQRKLSCMCIFNPHRLEPPAIPDGGDEERARRIERQELLLQAVFEERDRNGEEASWFLHPDAIREGVHTPVFRPCDADSFGALRSLLTQTTLGGSTNNLPPGFTAYPPPHQTHRSGSDTTDISSEHTRLGDSDEIDGGHKTDPWDFVLPHSQHQHVGGSCRGSVLGRHALFRGADDAEPGEESNQGLCEAKDDDDEEDDAFDQLGYRNTTPSWTQAAPTPSYMRA